MLQYLAAVAAPAQKPRYDYEWVMKVDDGTFVNIRDLQKFLGTFRSPDRELFYLGGRGYGRPADHGKMNLTRAYCMNGPGYVLSAATAAQIGPTIGECAAQMQLQNTVFTHWYSDVIVGKCIFDLLGIGCDLDPRQDRLPSSSSMATIDPPWARKKTASFDSRPKH
jgi:hypothetical protein